MVQAFRSSSPRWPIAVMACVLLVVACRTESDDAKEGSQTNDKKQGTTKTESVPLPTSKHASEEEPVQVDDRAAVHDVILAAKDEDSAAADAGTIKGVAEWNDAPFKQRPVPGVEGADPHCTRVHQKTPILRESLIVNPNSTVKDVLVYVKRGLPADKTWPVPCEHVLLDQNGCRYVPHVFGIMAGQGLVIRNSDATLHNIHCTPKNNPGFNTGQPQKGMEFNWKFGNAEIMIHLKCNSHAWMSAGPRLPRPESASA